jgi:hypothetical protein
MASPSDPEKDSNKAQSKTDNPFIKFRQFADQQISSLLQGILGLPSAFSGKPSENRRWAIFDEDLRRRDELQARQQELRESEARRLGRQGTDAEEYISTRTSADWPAFARWLEKATTSDHDNDGMRDVPLYSPITKSLFAHLHQPVDGDSLDWKKQDGVCHFWWPANPWLLKPYERSSNPLKTAQYMIRNDLNASTMLRSNYSLLPYLMFSPYSPFRLIESANSPHYQERDMFPYVDAFEDLIRITQPRPKPLILSKVFGNGLSIHYPDSDGVHEPDSELLRFDPATRANCYYNQIYHFHRSHLLQESEVLPPPQLHSIPFPVATDAQTEQEMYERFLRWASQPTEKFEAVVAEAKATFAKDLDSGKFPDIFRVFDKMLESKSVQELFEEFNDPADDFRKQKQAQQKAGCETLGEDPDKVISQSTTTQRVKQVDGSVRTYVHVWKMFADGRETTTTSSHTEEQERDEDGNLRPLVSMTEESKALSEMAKAEGEPKAKKASKNGWFWN